MAFAPNFTIERAPTARPWGTIHKCDFIREAILRKTSIHKTKSLQDERIRFGNRTWTMNEESSSFMENQNFFMLSESEQENLFGLIGPGLSERLPKEAQMFTIEKLRLKKRCFCKIVVEEFLKDRVRVSLQRAPEPKIRSWSAKDALETIKKSQKPAKRGELPVYQLQNPNSLIFHFDQAGDGFFQQFEFSVDGEDEAFDSFFSRSQKIYDRIFQEELSDQSSKDVWTEERLMALQWVEGYIAKEDLVTYVVPLKPGDELTGWIKEISDSGKILLCPHLWGEEGLDRAVGTIENWLILHGGQMALEMLNSAEKIFAELGLAQDMCLRALNRMMLCHRVFLCKHGMILKKYRGFGNYAKTRSIKSKQKTNKLRPSIFDEDDLNFGARELRDALMIYTDVFTNQEKNTKFKTDALKKAYPWMDPEYEKLREQRAKEELEEKRQLYLLQLREDTKITAKVTYH